MDFARTIMTAARQNAENNKKEVRYYSTKFEPPKKLERNKTLSANIQKFLAKKEAEEKQKAIEARERRDKLLELRSHDKKATRRVNVMLSRTKSANKSAIQDAVDRDHTSVTRAGPSQPDEDDYGYVSQSAAEFYNKMMEKYNSMPDEKKYDFTKKKANGNLSNTKDRVRSALDREQEEASQPHRRKRRHPEIADVADVQGEERRDEKPKPKIKPAPVINFSDLLKIAEKKQFEPIKVEAKKEKEEERLLTKKQKREQEKEREYREQREKREKERERGPQSTNSTQRIPKLSTTDNKPTAGKPTAPPPGDRKPHNSDTTQRKRDDSVRTKSNQSKCDNSTKRPEFTSKPNPTPSATSAKRERDSGAPSKTTNYREAPRKPSSGQNAVPQRNTARPKELPPREPPRDLGKPKQFPPKDLKPKQFPPPDMRMRDKPMKQRRPLPVNKGRFYDDDDEEYDSEMDDFIDDGPEEGEEDYSKHIREMFGYDKRRYRYIDEDDDNMESTFAQQMREECISTKIGIMEDLEELRKEEEHNRRKAMMKKRQK